MDTNKEIIFPHQHLTKLPGGEAPNYRSIRKLKTEVYANAASVQSTRGGGQAGCLGLILPTEEYEKISDIPFGVPVYPGEYIVYPPNANESVRAMVKNMWEQQMRDFDKCNRVSNKIKQQILEAVPEKYIKETFMFEAMVQK